MSRAARHGRAGVARRKPPSAGGGGAPPSDQPRFAIRYAFDIGVNNPTGLPWLCEDHTDPAGTLGITHVANAIPNTTVAAQLAGQGLKAFWWISSEARCRVNGSVGTNVWPIPRKVESGADTPGALFSNGGTGHIFIRKSSVTYKLACTYSGGSFQGSAAHPALVDGDEIIFWRNSDSWVTNAVNAVKSTTAGSDHYYIITDEVPNVGTNMLDAINDRCGVVRAADTSAKTILGEYTHTTRTFLDELASQTIGDVVMTTNYHIRGTSDTNPGSLQTADIDFEIAQAEAAALLSRPTVGGYTPALLQLFGTIGLHNLYYVNTTNVYPSPTGALNVKMPSTPTVNTSYTGVKTTPTDQIEEQTAKFRQSTAFDGIGAYGVGPAAFDFTTGADPGGVVDPNKPPNYTTTTGWRGHFRHRNDLFAPLEAALTHI